MSSKNLHYTMTSQRDHMHTYSYAFIFCYTHLYFLCLKQPYTPVLYKWLNGFNCEMNDNYNSITLLDLLGRNSRCASLLMPCPSKISIRKCHIKKLRTCLIGYSGFIACDGFNNLGVGTHTCMQMHVRMH